MHHDMDCEKICVPGLHVSSTATGTVCEYHLTARFVADVSPQQMLQQVASFLRGRRLTVICQEVFAPSDMTEAVGLLEKAFGQVDWPVTWIHQDRCTIPTLGGIQLWAISGSDVERLRVNDWVVGSVFENDGVTFCRLGGLAGQDPQATPAAQARSVLETMEEALHLADMDMSNVLRTWFHNDQILDWYDEFNRVRNGFFQERGVFEGLIPASTGIGVANRNGAALLGGLLAVKAQPGAVRVGVADSPLQGAASAYGSSFSRAVHIDSATQRRLLVSGTASIDERGRSVQLADTGLQINLTMRVVHAILKAQGMDWADVTRAIAFFKNADDAGLWQDYCREHELTKLPVLPVHADVCRDDLLWEIEVDALAGPGAYPLEGFP